MMARVSAVTAQDISASPRSAPRTGGPLARDRSLPHRATTMRLGGDTMPRFLAYALVLSMAIAGVAHAFAEPACDRACLRTLLDRYLSAVIAHDPAAAPIVVGFRQTENAVNVRPGNGVWK